MKDAVLGSVVLCCHLLVATKSVSLLYLMCFFFLSSAGMCSLVLVAQSVSVFLELSKFPSKIIILFFYSKGTVRISRVLVSLCIYYVRVVQLIL